MRKRSAVLLAAAVGAAAPLVLGRRGWPLFLLSNALVVYPTLRRNCDWFGPVVRRFRTEAREVWLTIDDGPDARDTPAYLRLLDRFGARATFFMIGRKVDALKSVAREVVAAGHEAANHTWSHPQAWFWALPPGRMRREIVAGRDAITEVTEREPCLFRSPVGMTNPFVHPVLDSIGVPLVGWSDSGVDGLGDRGPVVVERILAGLRPGGIIVLHEGGAPGRVETLELLLSRLNDAGFRCVIPTAESLR